eukprot:g4127.t1
MYLALAKNILLRQKQNNISFLKQSNKLLNSRFQNPTKNLSTSSSKDVTPGKINKAGWLIAFGSVPFTYFIGLSIRQSQDEKIEFEKEQKLKVQQLLNEKIAAFERLTEEQKAEKLLEIRLKQEEEDKEHEE